MASISSSAAKGKNGKRKCQELEHQPSSHPTGPSVPTASQQPRIPARSAMGHSRIFPISTYSVTGHSHVSPNREHLVPISDTWRPKSWENNPDAPVLPPRFSLSYHLGETNNLSGDLSSATLFNSIPEPDNPRYNAIVNGTTVFLSKGFDYQMFRRSLYRAAQKSGTMLPPSSLSIWYRKKSGPDIMLDDEFDYSIFLKRLDTGDLRLDALGAVVLSLLSAAQREKESDVGSEKEQAGWS